jgi:hypothetical protein
LIHLFLLSIEDTFSKKFYLIVTKIPVRKVFKNANFNYVH